MSHIMDVGVKLQSLDALEAGAARCGVQLVRGQRTNRYWGGLGKCDHAIVVPGSADAYEMGVVMQPDGTFRLEWDDFAGGKGLVGRVGAKAETLLKFHGIELAKELARQAGAEVVQEVELDNGLIKLVLQEA